MDINIDFHDEKTQKVLKIIGVIAFSILFIFLFFRQRGIDRDQNKKIAKHDTSINGLTDGQSMLADSLKFLEEQDKMHSQKEDSYDSTIAGMQDRMSVLQKKPKVIYNYTNPTNTNTSTSNQTPIIIHDTVKVTSPTDNPVVQSNTNDDDQAVESDDEDNGGNPFKGAAGENPFKGGGTNPFKK